MFMLVVDNMTCGKCVGRVEAKFSKAIAPAWLEYKIRLVH